MPTLERIVAGPSRRIDSWGSGQFGAARTGHVHQGLDIVARPGESIRTPIGGYVQREALPYANDPAYRGVVIRGTGEWRGYEVRLFYVEGLFCGSVDAGGVVGTAQDVTRKYPGITNHVHLEIRKDGHLVSPADLYGLCF